MARTAIAGDFASGNDGCWCCGDRTVRASLLRLRARPEAAVCFPCVNDLSGRMRELERMTRAAPAGPWWRRHQCRAGFNRC